jgi:hypothetical protein
MTCKNCTFWFHQWRKIGICTNDTAKHANDCIAGFHEICELFVEEQGQLKGQVDGQPDCERK